MEKYRLNTNIESVSELSTRLKNGLKSIGVNTINDILITETDKVVKLPYIGVGCLYEFVSFKEKYSYLTDEYMEEHKEKERIFEMTKCVVTGILSNETLTAMVIGNAKDKGVSVDEELALNVSECVKELLKTL